MKFIHTFLVLSFILIVSCSGSDRKEIYVSKQGNDSNSGTQASPLLSISKAAEVAKPGDTIIIGEGTYREYVNPPVGGLSDENRITFTSNENETVFIKGSEQIDNWKSSNDGLWSISLDTSYFNGYNPYVLKVDGDFQNYGQWHHRGDVYLNNSALSERQDLNEVRNTPYTWFTNTEEGITSIFANFDIENPNEELTEINVRELIFFATDTDVDYITLNGLRFLHAAPNWQAPNTGDADPNRLLQVGAVGSNMGKGWIIENSEISHSKTAGIMFGENEGPESSFLDITQFGDHIIRNNIITKNGQYGIAGQKGISRTTIEGNKIEDINYRNEFGGYEPAGIKIWNASDVYIENNFIHKVIANQSSTSQAYCIWIDFANQGTRITRNFLIGGDNTTTALFLEANVGPTLVDNNIIIDKPNGAIMVYSGGSIFAHNLFVDSNFDFKIQEFGNNGSGARRAYTLQPHSTIKTNNGIPVEIEYNQMFNNIFANANGPVNFGPANGIGNLVSNNLYIGGALPGADHVNSAVSYSDFEYSIKYTGTGVDFSFEMDDSFGELETPVVDADLIGIIPLAEQSIEDELGNPITVGRDFNNRKRNTSNPVLGPLSNLQAGTNLVSIGTKTLATPSNSYFVPVVTREN